jgi:DNA polymerase-3 subunit epsilon
MTGGQTALLLDPEPLMDSLADGACELVRREELKLIVVRASAEELAAHQAFLARMREAAGACLWRE